MVCSWRKNQGPDGDGFYPAGVSAIMGQRTEPKAVQSFAFFNRGSQRPQVGQYGVIRTGKVLPSHGTCPCPVRSTED